MTAGLPEGAYQRVILQAMEKYSDGVLALSHEDFDTIVYFSPGAEAVFGWTADEIVGKSITELVHPDKRQAHVSWVRKFYELGESRRALHQFKVQGWHKEGREIELWIGLHQKLLAATIHASDPALKNESGEIYEPLTLSDEQMSRLLDMPVFVSYVISEDPNVASNAHLEIPPSVLTATLGSEFTEMLTATKPGLPIVMGHVLLLKEMVARLWDLRDESIAMKKEHESSNSVRPLFSGAFIDVGNYDGWQQMVQYRSRAEIYCPVDTEIHCIQASPNRLIKSGGADIALSGETIFGVAEDSIPMAIYRPEKPHLIEGNSNFALTCKSNEFKPEKGDLDIVVWGRTLN